MSGTQRQFLITELRELGISEATTFHHITFNYVDRKYLQACCKTISSQRCSLRVL